MAETVQITCDRCGSEVAREERTRVAWGRRPGRRAPTDLCPECRAWLESALESSGPPPRAGGRR